MKVRLLIALVLALGAAALMVSSCVQLDPIQQAIPEEPPVAQETFLVLQPRADDILVYLQNVLGMPADLQAKECEQAQRDFTLSGQAEDRLRLVCLSLLPGRPLAERANAARLLDEYLADPKRDHGALEGLATLLKMQLNEQRSLQKQLSVEKDRTDSMTRQLNEQKAQLDELKTQLNELKKIEKIISDHEKAGVPEKQ